MTDNQFWVRFWLILAFFSLALILALRDYSLRTDREMLKAGYVYKMVPVRYEGAWVPVAWEKGE